MFSDKFVVEETIVRFDSEEARGEVSGDPWEDDREPAKSAEGAGVFSAEFEEPNLNLFLNLSM